MGDDAAFDEMMRLSRWREKLRGVGFRVVECEDPPPYEPPRVEYVGMIGGSRAAWETSPPGSVTRGPRP